jgi:hypothetical protein
MRNIQIRPTGVVSAHHRFQPRLLRLGELPQMPFPATTWTG